MRLSPSNVRSYAHQGDFLNFELNKDNESRYTNMACGRLTIERTDGKQEILRGGKIVYSGKEQVRELFNT